MNDDISGSTRRRPRLPSPPSSAQLARQLIGPRWTTQQLSNHWPFYAPVVEPTLTVGVAALVAAARMWLPMS
jgi:hypothetical protein